MKILKISILLVIMNFNRLAAQQKSNSSEDQRITYITGIIDDSLKGDTLSLVLNGPFFSYQTNPERFAAQILTTTADPNGKFKFKILTGNSPFHISLFLSSKRDKQSGVLVSNVGHGDISDYLIEPGDSIDVVFDKQKQYFSGKGSSLFEVQYKTEQTDDNGKMLRVETHNYFKKDIEKWFSQMDSVLDAQLNVLEFYKSKLSPTAYSIICADIIGVNRKYVYSTISSQAPFYDLRNPLGQDLATLCKKLENRPAYISLEDRATLSPKYVDYLYNKLKMEIMYERIVTKINPRLDFNYFAVIDEQFTGILRDKLLAWWLTDVSSVNSLFPDYVDNALAVMQTPVFIQMVYQLKETYSKGQPVTDFDFEDSKGKIVHLGAFKGKVLLVDLWFTGCGGCIAVAAGLPHVEEAFKNRQDVAFVSISIDRNRNLWLKSIDKNPIGKKYTHYTTPGTTYLYTAGTGENNPFVKKYVPVGAFPQLLIIDKKGNIFSSTPSRPVNVELQRSLIKEINEALTSQ